MGTAGGGWDAVLAPALSGQAHAAVVAAEGAAVTGAAVWAGAGRWAAWLREAGVGPGDRVVCALPPGPGFVMLLVAALAGGLTFVPVPPGADAEAHLEEVDGRIAVVGPAGGAAPGLARAERDGGPPGVLVAPRPARGAPTRDARFLVQTSGTAGAPRRVALSDANVRAVLASHRAPLALDGGAALSVLPWHHVFGLVLELLPALLGGATLVRERSGGRDPGALLAAARAWPITHLHAVPLTLRLLAERDDGLALLRRLRAGLVGGAPVSAALAERLSATRLRVGYGQTEASPGICLGEAGAWRAHTLGRPLGCDVRLDDDGVLAFRGPNAHLGTWRDGALDRHAPGRWVRTGDLAREEPDGAYTFEGRAADAFKLENGRYVPAPEAERRVRARWPQLVEAVLSSPDGRALVLAVSTERAADPVPDGAAVAAELAPLLGPRAAHPVGVVRVARDAWAFTPKGELDRRHPTGLAPAARADPA